MREASPVTYVKKGMPPFLFVHGTADRTAYSPTKPRKMCEKMKQVGGSVRDSRWWKAAGMGSWTGRKIPPRQAYKGEGSAVAAQDDALVE